MNTPSPILTHRLRTYVAAPHLDAAQRREHADQRARQARASYRAAWTPARHPLLIAAAAAISVAAAATLGRNASFAAHAALGVGVYAALTIVAVVATWPRDTDDEDAGVTHVEVSPDMHAVAKILDREHATRPSLHQSLWDAALARHELATLDSELAASGSSPEQTYRLAARRTHTLENDARLVAGLKMWPEPTPLPARERAAATNGHR